MESLHCAARALCLLLVQHSPTLQLRLSEQYCLKCPKQGVEPPVLDPAARAHAGAGGAGPAGGPGTAGAFGFLHVDSLVPRPACHPVPYQACLCLLSPALKRLSAGANHARSAHASVLACLAGAAKLVAVGVERGDRGCRGAGTGRAHLLLVSPIVLAVVLASWGWGQCMASACLQE